MSSILQVNGNIHGLVLDSLRFVSGGVTSTASTICSRASSLIGGTRIFTAGSAIPDFGDFLVDQRHRDVHSLLRDSFLNVLLWRLPWMLPRKLWSCHVRGSSLCGRWDVVAEHSVSTLEDLLAGAGFGLGAVDPFLDERASTTWQLLLRKAVERERWSFAVRGAAGS